MGLVTPGIPEQIAVELARLNGSTVFVESGTFHGATTRWAAGHFEIVHTIERSESLHNLHGGELARIAGVHTHLGDSRDVLPRIIREIQGRRALFWLDGHWSCGETAGEHDECPLLGELACLSGRNGDIILIDDALFFLSAAPAPYDPAQWPTISDIIDVLPASPMRPFVQIVDDVIFIVPDEPALRNRLVEHARARSNHFWEEFRRLQQRKQSLGARLKGLFSETRRGTAGR